MKKKRSIRVGGRDFSMPADAEDLVSKANVVMVEGDNQKRKSLRVNFAKYLRFGFMFRKRREKPKL